MLAPTKTKGLPDGSDVRAINAKGDVPMLELDNGERLTKGVAIVQDIADQVTRILAWRARVAARPVMPAAMRAEGIA